MSLTLLDGVAITLAAVAVYAIVVYLLYRAGRLGPERALQLYGPALLVKTRRFRGWLDRIGRFKRFWSVVGDVGIIAAAVAMIAIVAVLALDAVVISHVPASAAPPPQEALGIPGINPIIPIGYGLVALVVGIVLHELFHGVIARSQNVGVKSVGILWCVIPVGAFVEQDEEEMTHAPRRRRDRIAAAGVLANFVLAGLFLGATALVLTTSIAPNANGVGISYVVPGAPAANATLVAGDIITSINGTPTANDAQLLNVLDASHAGATMPLTYYSAPNHRLVTTNVTLAPLSSFTGNPADAKHGFLGISPTFLTPSQLTTVLGTPWAGPGSPLLGVTDWIVLPLAGLEPVQGTTESFYHTTGPLAGADPNSVWIVVNLLYWLAWMNLLLGLSNALPLVPFDGGLLFRDFVGGIAARARTSWDAARLERFTGRVTAAASVAVLFLLLWQFVGPRL
ncbi:MAG TPA: site-2 protease family protein [Thermoplasmata archaeon]|nr:site-2 protease family protein [Thermoplasmata archaeon]